MGLSSVILTTWVVAFVASESQDSVLSLFPEFHEVLADYEGRLAAVENKLSLNKVYFFGAYHDYPRTVNIARGSKIPFWGQAEPSTAFNGGVFTLPNAGVYVITVKVSTPNDTGFSAKLVIENYASWRLKVTDGKRSETLSWVLKIQAGYKVYVLQDDDCCRALEEATLGVFRLY